MPELEQVRLAAQRHFALDPLNPDDQKEWATVQSNLNTMWGSDTEVYECEPKASLFHGLCGSAYAITLSNIHLCPSFFRGSRLEGNHLFQATVLIHEWAHRCRDVIYLLEDYCNSSYYKSYPYKEDRVRLADAYAMYCFELYTGYQVDCIPI